MSAFQNHADSQNSPSVTGVNPTVVAEALKAHTESVESSASPLEAKDAATVSFVAGTKLREIERIVILETLKQKSFNRTHTARALGIGIRTLQRKLKRYGASDWGLKNWKGNA